MQRLLDFYYAAVVKPNKSESQVLAKLEAADNIKTKQNIDRNVQVNTHLLLAMIKHVGIIFDEKDQQEIFNKLRQEIPELYQNNVESLLYDSIKDLISNEIHANQLRKNR